MSKAKAKVAVKQEEEEEDVEVEAEETEDAEENGAEENGDEENEDEEADAQSQKSSQSKKSKQSSKKSNARNKKADKAKSKKKAVKVVRRAEKQPAGSDDGDNAAADDLADDMDGANLDDEVKDDGYRHCTGVLTSRPTAKDVKISNFAMAAYGHQLILDAVLEFSIGQRYGLIGPNGSGKSSLLRALANREVPIPHHIDIFLLEEEAKPSDMTALETVIASVEEKMKIYEEEAEKAIEEFGPDSDIVTDLYARLEDLDPTTFKARAGKILFGLGFDNAMMEKKTKDMSGGWRMRVALAQALFAKPTLLLLDEPTNHLDLEACVWLENYLSKYDRCLVVVSHSQDFLNGVCTNIIHITPKRKLQVYGGNYDTFVQVKTENETNQMKRYKKEQEDIKHIKSFIASCGTYSNLVRQGKSKQKIIDKMVAAGLTEAVIQEARPNFKFPEVEYLPPPILAFDDVSFAYSGEYKDALYHHLNVGVQMDSRIALVGPNGAGKSTLLKLMAGELVATVGTVRRHLNLVIGRYHQHSTDQLDENMTPLDYIRKVYADRKLGEEDWRQHLGKFGVSGKMQTALIRKMSDGQKSRLVFSLMSVLRPHLLLFDEPTNHLDIECIDALADAINEFKGGMVLVSHDFRLISQVAKQVWVCDKKSITVWPGDIRSYKQSLMAKMNL